MALSFTSLNSGSNGNCYYIENQNDAILVDAGITCRETEKRMERLGLSMTKVRAIFVSHEHSDHIRGIPVIAKKYKLPVFITEGTLKKSGFSLESHLLRTFKAHEAVQIGDLEITAFPKFHDASEPHSFIISCNGIKVGVFTDIGIPCENVIRYFSACHAAFLEANYDEDMLENGRYPYHLKARIRGGHGHLSNKQALDLFCNNGTHMSHLLLSHLSRDNNNPDLVLELFKSRSQGTEIIVASREMETKVYHIIHPSIVPIEKKAKIEFVQYSLFS
ncbi:Phosphoribosyl 1,2-cyclic phosphodiesterase [Daejeonella rubra]|uniref:Phosphoribosyl 1,2-cyclic phosphodiesterase n=1 Tax=Daejeonella rubra TaxID=990371 RepID=A0A1G9TW20_9SPHI|nr:MBL fold metallo-hydrolase [Daejeonella rubra]SDM51604.1 Phosphoribosyl 1,2-cyclic phosphodiesterase [Daejeonella rubra]